MNLENFERAKEIEKSISNFEKEIIKLNEMNDCIEKNDQHFQENMVLGFYFSNKDYKAIFDVNSFKSMIYSRIKTFEIAIEKLKKEFESL